MSLVTVILPAYNAGRYIADTVGSLLVQTYPSLEIIVVNDGSTDDTGDVVKGIAKEYSNVKLVDQPNRGCSSAKNTGLAIAKGDFVQYLDADDILSPDKIGEQVAALRYQPMKVAVCRTRIFSETIADASETDLDPEFIHSSEDGFEFLLELYGLNGRDGMVQPNAFLISRELALKAGSWNESISPSRDEDGEYFCRVILASEGVIFTPAGLNYYRKQVKSGSLSNQSSEKHAKGGLLSLQCKTSQMLSRENSDRVRKVMSYHFLLFIYQHHEHFPAICEEAWRSVEELGVKELPLVGGSSFRKLSKILGFRRALKARALFR